jgi:hypothetical protein
VQSTSPFSSVAPISEWSNPRIRLMGFRNIRHTKRRSLVDAFELMKAISVRGGKKEGPIKKEQTGFPAALSCSPA